LIGRPDRSFHRERRMFRRSRTAETKTRHVSRDYWPGAWEKISRYLRKDENQNCNTEQDLTTNRIDKPLRRALLQNESGS
jgi:hypothetical protein